MAGAIKDLVELLLTEIAIQGTDGEFDALMIPAFVPLFFLSLLPLPVWARCLPSSPPASCLLPVSVISWQNSFYFLFQPHLTPLHALDIFVL